MIKVPGAFLKFYYFFIIYLEGTGQGKTKNSAHHVSSSMVFHSNCLSPTQQLILRSSSVDTLVTNQVPYPLKVIRSAHKCTHSYEKFITFCHKDNVFFHNFCHSYE